MKMFGLLILVTVGFLFISPAFVSSVLKAGTAKINITPPDPKYPVHDSLYSRSLILEVNGIRIAFLSFVAWNNFELSADYAGYATKYTEEAFGNQINCLFIQGGAGNQAPGLIEVGAGERIMAKQLGNYYRMTGLMRNQPGPNDGTVLP